tara:strand:+ start:8698 stop:9576 length:879 start_codon:yes stop_codon:yes gene_type:complete
MIFIAILFLSAFLLSGVAAFYSIVGLISIFPAAEIPIVIMGISLEICKLVAASWCYRNWKNAPVVMKYYFATAVLVLSFITSMGIFGFLSKAHIEQTTIAGDNSLQIGLLENKIQREIKRIKDADLVISQLDQTVQTLMDFDRVRGPQGAIAVRESQKKERDNLNTIIDKAQDKVSGYQQENLILSKQQIKIEAEVGPIKYIAEFLYGEADRKLVEKAVRAVIIIIVLVFDPLAIILLIAANREMKIVSVSNKRRKTRSIPKQSIDKSKVSIDKNDISVLPKEIIDRFFNSK